MAVRSLQHAVCATVFLLIIHIHFPASSQIRDTLHKDSLCEYTWNSDINDCPDVLDYIRPFQWKDTVIMVQKNISHISKHGFKLCVTDLQLTNPAEIVYIMDLSSSMNPACGENAGDPYKKRPEALQAGFGFQIDSAANSLAGYIGFHQELQSGQLLPPVAVNTTAGINVLNQMVQVLQLWVDEHEDDDYGFSTNYRNPIRKVLEYFDVRKGKHSNTQAIVFVSDGEPYPSVQEAGATEEQINTLVQNKIPVHGVFLSKNHPPNTHLEYIAQKTGGSITHVPPANTDTLAKVVKKIISSLIDPVTPAGLSISNLTNGSTAKAVSFDKINDTVWSAEMNKTVALKPELNDIEVGIQLQSPGGIDTTMTFKFFIDVGGEPDFTSACYNCWYRTQIKVLVNNVKVDTLTDQNDRYTVQLEYYGIDTLDTVAVAVKTNQKGDSEVIAITDWSFDGEKFIYTKTVPFAVLNPSQNATINNDTTEAGFVDLLALAWQHPDEVMDTAYTEVVVNTLPDKMTIHSKAGQPTAATKYATAPAADTISAGDMMELYAKVFSDTTWLKKYENSPNLSKLITWDIVDAFTGLPDSSIGTLAVDSNSHNSFFPVKAYHTVDITASLPVITGAVKETVRFYIAPGAPKMVVIENTNDINQTQDLNNPCHWSPVKLFSNQTHITAYGVLRDSLGNWIGPAEQAVWWVDDTSVVTVVPGPDDEGNIHKSTKPSGQTLIHAGQSPLAEDTAVVVTKEYQIDSIRIVRLQSADTADIFSLTMNSNEDTTIYVFGRRNDFKTWIPVPARWGIAPAATEQNPPAAATNWVFSPSKPGTGNIYVDFSGKSDTIQYQFTAGPPISISFTMITPDSLLIAGKTVRGVVSLMNEDGLVPGTLKYTDTVKAAYMDVLSDGTDDPVNPVHPQWIPVCMTDQDTAAFTNKELSINQWVIDGLDTVDFVLYYAPDSKGPHRLTARLRSLSAVTAPFVLKPAILDTIVVAPDTLPTLTVTDPAFIITARGYDTFGNRNPGALFTWASDASLIDFSINAVSSQVYIYPSSATITQQGYIHVFSNGDTSITNKVYLKILSPLPYLLSATTRDFTGNGFLDALELQFNKKVTIPPGYDPGNILVQKVNSSIYYLIDSLALAPFSDSTRYMLYLDESNKSILTDLPETDWVIELTIDDLDSIKSVCRHRCADGAAPVIWQAGFTPGSAKDIVLVIMSEKFYNSNGESFLNAGPVPGAVFNVWDLDSTVFVENDSALAGITQFLDQESRWVTFKMTNGQDLSFTQYLNLDPAQGYIADKHGNIPGVNNQKVRLSTNIDIVFTPQQKVSEKGVTAVPNPVPGDGAVQFSLPVSTYHEGLLRIYDTVGNVVDEISLPRNRNAVTWDLRNKNRRKVAAGTYLAVFIYKDPVSGTYMVSKTTIGITE